MPTYLNKAWHFPSYLQRKLILR